ncbi:hypothetical protein ACFL1E_01160 [Candidatus Omnitrophota bacterium]
MNRIAQHKGFLLIGTFITLIVLTVLAGGIFAKSINENMVVKKNISKLSAMYNAEMGGVCAHYELVRHGTYWVTHSVAETGDDPLLLLNGGVARDVILSSIADHDPGAYDGAYRALNGEFLVKIYIDPIDGQFIILSRGISADGDTALLASKVATASLYEYFWFNPEDSWPSWTTYEANGGKIHTNGNLALYDGVKILDVKELTAAGYIFYRQSTFLPPDITEAYDEGGAPLPMPAGITWEDIVFWLRDPWKDPMDLDIYPYYNNVDGRVSGMQGGLYMDNPMPEGDAYVPCEGAFANCYLPQPNPVLAGGHDVTKINPELYQYEGYNISGNTSLGLRYAHTQIRKFEGATTVKLPSLMNTSWPHHLHRLTYEGRPYGGNTYYYPPPGSPITIPVKTTNSEHQLSDWSDWVTDNEFQGVIKEHNTEANRITPLRINSTTYFDSAQTAGMYIALDGELSCVGGGDTTLKITINANIDGDPEIEQVEVCPDMNGVYSYGGFEIAALDDFMDPNSALVKEVIKLDLGNLGDANIWPENGIIYATHNIALTNAAILAKPLTTVAKENCYLVGNYNVLEDDWQPSAVIGGEKTYTLSTDFFANMEAVEAVAPDGLPNPRHNPNYPYVEDEFSTDLDCDPSQGGDGCIGGTGPEDDFWDDDPDPNNSWQDEKAGTMTPLVTDDHVYNVSIIGYDAYPPYVLESWCEEDDGVCVQRKVVGAFVNLEEDNFRWNNYPSTSWPDFDQDKARRCDDDFMIANYPNAPCRGEQSRGWPHEMGSKIPIGNDNWFEFEIRYDIQDPSTLPPGELPGFFDSIFLAIPDSDYDFTHHPSELSPGVIGGGG